MNPEQIAEVKKIAQYASCTEDETLAVILEAGIKAVTLSAHKIQRQIDYNALRKDLQIKGRFLYWFPTNEIHSYESIPSESSWHGALGLQQIPIKTA